MSLPPGTKMLEKGVAGFTSARVKSVEWQTEEVEWGLLMGQGPAASRLVLPAADSQ